jgi:6-phosphofructokinase 2
MSEILTVTLNPALDVTTEVEALRPDQKLRCSAPRLDPGGGGANVSRALAKLGRRSRAFVAVGGAFGQAYRMLLEGEGLDVAWFESEGETRESLAVHDRQAGRQYRFVMPGARWSEDGCRRSLEALEDLMTPDGLVVLSGSLPPGVPEDYALRLAEAAARSGARLVVDTSGPALTRTARSEAGVHLLRMDRHEAAELMEVEEVGEAEALELSRDIVERGAAEIAVVTIGAAGAVGATADGAWRVQPPKREIVSSTGAGDSFVAGLCHGLVGERAFPEALRLAMAAASSAVTTPATELLTREGTEAALEEVQLRGL